MDASISARPYGACLRGPLTLNVRGQQMLAGAVYPVLAKLLEEWRLKPICRSGGVGGARSVDW